MFCVAMKFCDKFLISKAATSTLLVSPTKFANPSSVKAMGSCEDVVDDPLAKLGGNNAIKGFLKWGTSHGPIVGLQVCIC
jgi:hypothetical protein